ncbi:HEAT repeat domain-containing protein [Streptomyces sp. NPDC059786]|uniref:HEAT repeat domain-containing protein n=1 Tax=Streptomyces sp. NPDC059786 TaxID=3346946 RepID=UPI003665EB06
MPSPHRPTPPGSRAGAATAWQVRAGGATALSGADAGTAVPALAKALADPDGDVRKAAVLSLVRHAGTGEDARAGTGEDLRAGAREDALAALATATSDSDADVRAYAARAL